MSASASASASDASSAAAPPPPPAPAAAAQDMEELRKSVVCVLMKDGDGLVQSMGSGFVIRASPADGKCIVMTCFHVLSEFNASQHTIHVRMCGGDVELPAQTMHSNEASDLLILQVVTDELEEEDHPRPLEFGNTQEVPLHGAVVLLGYMTPPLVMDERPDGSVVPKWVIPKLPGASPGVTTGPLRRLQPGWNEDFPSNYRSQTGCSGGPVMSHNRVVGVHKSQNRKTGYAVATGTVNAVMNIWIGTKENMMTTEEVINRLPL